MPSFSALSLRKTGLPPLSSSSVNSNTTTAATSSVRRPFRALTSLHTTPSNPYQTNLSSTTFTTDATTEPSSLPAKSSFATRQRARVAADATKAKEREMKAEKQAEKEEAVRKIKEKRERATERKRWEEMEAKMHKKRVERKRRREGRRKLKG